MFDLDLIWLHAVTEVVTLCRNVLCVRLQFVSCSEFQRANVVFKRAALDSWSVLLGIRAPQVSNSFTDSMRKMTSWRAVESATHSASVALKAMAVCILLDHEMGQSAHMMTQPVRERHD